MIIRSVKTVSPFYGEGNEVSLSIEVQKQYEDGGFIGSIYDDVTDIMIQNWSDTLKENEREFYRVNIKPMPSEDWVVRIVVSDSPSIIVIREASGSFFEVPPDIEVFTIPYGEIDEPPDMEIIDVVEGFEIIDTVSPDTPFWATWLIPFTDLFSNVTEAVVNWLAPTPLDLNKLFAFFKDPVGTVNAKLGEFFSKSVTESTSHAETIYMDAVSETPEDVKGLREAIQNSGFKLPTQITTTLRNNLGLLDDVTVEGSGKTGDELTRALLNDTVTLWSIEAVIESMSLGQVESYSQLSNRMYGMMGLSNISSRLFTSAFEWGLFKKLDRLNARKYMPSLPSIDWLINMVVKEKLTVPEFTNIMRDTGLDPKWGQLIWDSHFIAPNLTQLLHSWRLGTITEERLKELQILVDLDPLYNEVWFDQWYDIPTRRETRYLFELGVIDLDTVKKLVFQSGVHPSYQDGIVQYIIGFQERNWRQRYLVQLSNAYRLDIIDSTTLRNEILDANYTDGVADWMIKTEDVKRKIDDSKTVKPREKVLPYSVVYDSFILEKENVDWVRVKLFELGYEPEDIDSIVEVWENEKYNREVGKKTGGLSVSQILMGMRRKALTLSGRTMVEDISELELETIIEGEKDRARELLSLKGLSDEFIDILITSTLRKG